MTRCEHHVGGLPALPLVSLFFFLCFAPSAYPRCCLSAPPVLFLCVGGRAPSPRPRPRHAYRTAGLPPRRPPGTTATGRRCRGTPAADATMRVPLGDHPLCVTVVEVVAAVSPTSQGGFKDATTAVSMSPLPPVAARGTRRGGDGSGGSGGGCGRAPQRGSGGGGAAPPSTANSASVRPPRLNLGRHFVRIGPALDGQMLGGAVEYQNGKLRAPHPVERRRFLSVRNNHRTARGSHGSTTGRRRPPSPLRAGAGSPARCAARASQNRAAREGAFGAVGRRPRRPACGPSPTAPGKHTVLSVLGQPRDCVERHHQRVPTRAWSRHPRPSAPASRRQLASRRAVSHSLASRPPGGVERDKSCRRCHPTRLGRGCGVRMA